METFRPDPDDLRIHFLHADCHGRQGMSTDIMIQLPNKCVMHYLHVKVDPGTDGHVLALSMYAKMFPDSTGTDSTPK